ncbi:ladinin-1 [Lampris incognitus]|uniref:ladinin-1 n=1 Tax=Lampris incognitus TaxID=2546036 RepID=UPI0024B4FCFA|nr:ladinin-1 [Lampris incognitus]
MAPFSCERPPRELWLMRQNALASWTPDIDQLQVDFEEMLRVRDEKRRIRHVETLRQQKEEEDEEGRGRGGEGGGARVELLGDLEEEEEEGRRKPPSSTAARPSAPPATTATVTTRKSENGELPDKDPEPQTTSRPSRKFVSSSVSISLDKTPSTSERSGHTTPMSPCSPCAPLSPREQWSSPCQSQTQNGHTQEVSMNGSPTNSSVSFEQITRPAFARQSSRTASFRMLKKKEEESMPLQRSSSVRVASKKFESDADQSQDEDQTSPFQRSSKQRVSSRSIQEKMAKLAQAAQKSEAMRSPDVTQRTLFLLDEVSRKRCLFEEPQATPPTSPGVSRQEFRGFTSGMSERINRWITKKNQTGSSQIPTDLRHVNISFKRSLFENRGEDDLPNTGPGRTSK